MSRLIETIRYEDGSLFNLQYHERRMEHAYSEVFGISRRDDLKSLLGPLPKARGCCKVRILYDNKSMEVEFTSYRPRPIGSLKIVSDNSITYDHKWENRDALMTNLEKKGECDDILIIKNGFVTDTSYSNIIFRTGSRWVTPATPLLRGTMRQSLLDDQALYEDEIRLEDLRLFKGFKLINAMLRNDSDEMPMERIIQ